MGFGGFEGSRSFNGVVMTNLSDVFILDVSDVENVKKHRNKKHCLCVSVSGMCLFINTEDREMYNGVKIEGYDFLKGQPRYVGCSKFFRFSEDRIIEKVGSLTYADMERIANKLKMARNKNALKDIIFELEKWLESHSHVDSLIKVFKSH